MTKLILIFLLFISTRVIAESDYVERLNNNCSIDSFKINNLSIKENILIDNLSTLSACIDQIEINDFDNDNTQELILYTSSSGGSGIQVKNKIFLDTTDNELIIIEAPQYYRETAFAIYVFPKEEHESIVNFFNENNISEDYTREITSFYISSDKQIEIYNEISISLKPKYLSDKFDTINTNFTEGTCRYYYGNIDLRNKIKLDLSDNEKELCNIIN